MDKQDKPLLSLEELDRRSFLKQAALAGAAIGLTGVAGVRAQAAPATADQLVRGKNAALRVLASRPIVMETTLAIMRTEQITDKANLFVRNNIDLPGLNTTEPNVQPAWTLEIGGLVDTPLRVTVEELSRLPQVEVTSVLKCSGNGRTFFEPRPSGNPWTFGGMGQVTWRGVLLKTLLEARGARLRETARFITINAATPDGVAPFEKSVPISTLETAMLALGMNGEALPAVHGGPLRFVAPGIFGVNQVKWLSRLEFAAAESTSPEQMPRYRVPFLPGQNVPILPTPPGTRWNYTFENSRPNWNLNINSYIWTPLADEGLRGRRVEIRGIAWNDGVVPVERVDVSLDGGTNWRKAHIEADAGRYGWYHWVAPRLLDPGSHLVMARATDALGRSQPMNGNLWWNDRGYEWNGIKRVRFNVT